MTDIYFDDDTNDIVVEGGDLLLTGDSGQVETSRQSIVASLKIFQGEWFLDNQFAPVIGVPYIQRILGQKGLSNEVLNSIMTNAILSNTNVSQVEEVVSSLDNTTRNLSVNFTCTLKSGQTLEESLTINI